MSALSEIQTYWGGNGTLTSAVPASRFYSVRQATGSAMPYVVVMEVSKQSDYLTGTVYPETVGIQFDVYDTSLATAESIADTIEAQFAYKPISAATISFEQTGRSTIAEEQADNKRVYHVMLQFDFNRNASLS